MAQLTYRGIVLDFLYTKEIYRKDIFTPDETVYLYTHWRFWAVFLINPAYTSYNQALGQARVQAGQDCVTTDRAIRWILAQPQGQLIYRVGGRTLLSLPDPGRLSDARNGPLPLMEPVITIHGDKTLTVEYAIECFAEESPLDARGRKRVCLAHRWTSHHDVGEHYLAERHIDGEVHFNVAELRAAPLHADDFRQVLIHPIPEGFKRENLRVWVTSDETRLQYSFVDRQLTHSIPANRGSVKIEAYQTIQVDMPSVGQAAWNLAVQGAQQFGNNVFQAAPAAFAAFGRFIQSIIPRFFKHVHISAWGNNATSRWTLTTEVLAILVARLFPAGINNVRAGPGMSFSLTHSLGAGGGNDKFVEAQGTVRFEANPLTVLEMLGVNLLNHFPVNEQITSPIDGQIVVQNPPGVHHPPENARGTRGTWLAVIVAESLQFPGQLPIDPPQLDVVANDQPNLS